MSGKVRVCQVQEPLPELMLHAAESARAIPCPRCGQSSTQIKSLRTGVLVFLGVGAFWRTWTETGCVSCVRGRLLEFTALNLLTAHIAWPFAVLPWMTVQLMRTALEGHRPEILRQLGLPVPPRRPMWVQFQEQLPVTFRVIGLIQILLGVLLMAGIVFVLGELRFEPVKLDLLIGLAFVAVVDMVIGYLTYSGLSKVLGLAPSVWHRVGVATLLGAALALSSPWIAQMGRLLR